MTADDFAAWGVEVDDLLDLDKLRPVVEHAISCLSPQELARRVAAARLRPGVTAHPVDEDGYLRLDWPAGDELARVNVLVLLRDEAGEGP
jgi:hypothetical protein